jgi:hypothetical protein
MKHLKKFETFEINESVLGTIGAIVLGIIGLRLIATIAVTIFGVKKLKNMKGKEKLKELVNKFEKDYTKKKPNEKKRMELWKDTVLDMIEKEEITNGYGIFETFQDMKKLNSIEIEVEVNGKKTSDFKFF